MFIDIILNSDGVIDALLKILLCALAVMLAFSVHECCHGLMALAFGDDTAKSEGRLTLNPFAHMSWIGLVLLFLLGFGWGRPVNVRTAKMKHPKAGLMMTAAAGPLSNILLAFIAYFCYLLTVNQTIHSQTELTILTYVAIFLSYLLSLNLGLCIFNLIPIPPLDGSKIVGELLPVTARYKYYSIQKYSLFIFLGLIILLNRVNVLGYVASWIISGFDLILSPLIGVIFS